MIEPGAAEHQFAQPVAERFAVQLVEQAGMVGRYYWYLHTKAGELGYSPRRAREALIETISWLAASPHIARETRTDMHLSPDIYRFRSAKSEILH